MAKRTNTNKILFRVGLLIVMAVLLYNSVYFESLDSRKMAQKEGGMEPSKFADDFFENKLETIPTYKAETLMESLRSDFEATLSSKGRQLGISNNYYFMIDSKAVVKRIETENVVVNLLSRESDSLYIATDFIFGNAIREASGLVSIGDYQNTMDFNNISVAINDHVRSNIVKPFAEKIKLGDTLFFKGAVKVNSKEKQSSMLRVIPVKLIID